MSVLTINSQSMLIANDENTNWIDNKRQPGGVVTTAHFWVYNHLLTFGLFHDTTYLGVFVVPMEIID